jgi:hypothetical protein
MPFYSRDKKGEWVPIKSETTLYSHNGGTESKLLAVLAPLDDDGQAMHIKVVEPESLVIVYGPGFMKLVYDEAIVCRGDFFLQNRKTRKIILVIYQPNSKKKQGEQPASPKTQRAQRLQPDHETPDGDISLDG